MADNLGTLSFASWLRQGLAAGITRTDGNGASGSDTIASITVSFDTVSTKAEFHPRRPRRHRGPRRQRHRSRRPTADDNDAEFEGLALIEFDQADLPWRYTPAAANTAGQLRPWMSLLVLKDGEGSLAPPTPALKQAVLTVTEPKALPNLSEAWAWAHTQFVGQNLAAEDLANQVKGARGQFVSRIICPRKLEASSSYLACLVPTFRRGAVLARTGQPPDDTVDALEAAWATPAQAGIKLPVYHSWRFQTGTVGSFRQLAKLIQPKALPSDMGRRAMDVGNPGLGLPTASTASPPTLQAEGALQSVQAFQSGPPPHADPTTWVQKLTKVLNQPEVTIGNATVKVVAPPLYGRWYAAETALDAPPTGSNPPWFYTLNSDPPSRVGAGLGTVVVQDHQQALLASAWNQVGEINAINSRLKVAQLGREIAGRIYRRHVVPGTADTFWTMTGRLHAFATCSGKTLCTQLDSSPVGHWISTRLGGDFLVPSARSAAFKGNPRCPRGSRRTSSPG